MKPIASNETTIVINRVHCMFGFPNQKKMIRTMFLHLMSDGFRLTCEKGELFIPYERIVSFKTIGRVFFVALKSYYDQFQTGIELEYLSNDGARNVIQLQFFASIPVSMEKNDAALKDMLTKMKQNHIFEKFACAQPPKQQETPDIISQIERLGELHKAGILTDAEFESKKAELLKRL